jgi:D-tyrosyl-tRNA(Tyr) deacylase
VEVAFNEPGFRPIERRLPHREYAGADHGTNPHRDGTTQAEGTNQPARWIVLRWTIHAGHGSTVEVADELQSKWHAVPMRGVVQRARDARVSVAGEIVGSFEGPGIVLLVGVTHDDDAVTAALLADKVYGLRIFEHHHARDRTCLPPSAPKEISAKDLGLPVLVISQFTLYAETKKGRRPTWDRAAPGPVAEPVVDAVAESLRGMGAQVATGRFGADMQVSFTNDGPMTVILDV